MSFLLIIGPPDSDRKGSWRVAYAYASRHLAAYPLASSPDARALVSRLVPFLVSRDDKTCFPGIESASTDIFSRFGDVVRDKKSYDTRSSFFNHPQGLITPSAFALLLRDAATLIRPPLVAEEGEEGPLALRALSDLHDLFKPRAPRTAAKIVFYAAQVKQHASSSAVLRVVAADAERWAAKVESESQSKMGPAAEEVSGGVSLGDSSTTREKPRIVELS